MERATDSPQSLYSIDGHRKYLTPAERRRFIDAALSHPRPAVTTLCLILAFTGCRISEALALAGRSFDLDEKSVAIRSLKKRNALIFREVPLPPCLIARLEVVHGLAQARPSDRLWTWTRGRAWSLIKEVMIAAQIPPGIHATAKGLRHAFGINAIRSGVPITFVQRWLGHASLSTTAIYLQAIGPEEREIAARMW